jgi:acetate kinase
MGLKIDAPSNEAGNKKISSSDSEIDVYIIPTNEDASILASVSL